MQTAIAYSRILRQIASHKTEQEKVHAEQRLHGISSRVERSSTPTSAHGPSACSARVPRRAYRRK